MALEHENRRKRLEWQPAAVRHLDAGPPVERERATRGIAAIREGDRRLLGDPVEPNPQRLAPWQAPRKAVA